MPDDNPTPNKIAGKPVHAFLVQTGILLHQFGTPSHRFERVMVHVARSLGVEGAFLYTPTTLVLSITDSDGEATYVRRVDSGAVDVDKLIRFDAILEQVVKGTLELDVASDRLEQVARAKPPYPAWVTILACGLACATIAVLFQGTWREIAASGVLGMVVAILETFLPTRNLEERGLLQPLAGFAAAVGALLAARIAGPLDDRLVTLAALIVLIPGLTITVSLTELAVGHLSAGIARLSGAGVSLLTMIVGVGLGWELAGAWRHMPGITRAVDLVWWQWVAVLFAPVYFAIVFRARPPQWPAIIAVTVSGFVTSTLTKSHWGPEAGAFMGALLVSMGSNAIARICNRPALVFLTPGILILVPGSLGYKSLVAFIDRETTVGVDLAFNMLAVAASLVGGILMANLFVPPRRIL